MSKEISVKVVKNFIDLMNEAAHIVNIHYSKQGIPVGLVQHTLAIVCQDGFTMSIQASAHHYCEPRQNFFQVEKESKQYYYGDAGYLNLPNKFETVIDYNIYTHFEIGYPNQEETLLISYAEDPTKLTDTVYGYVPKQLIEEVIEKHGGAVAFCSDSLN